jgi:hypothetical protein
LTVASETNSCRAISPLDSPWATCTSTSRSRSVRQDSSGGGGASPLAAAGELVDQAPGGRRGNDGTAGVHGSDREEQFFGRDVLQQEAAGPGLQRGEGVLVEVERGQHQDPGTVAGQPDPPGGLHPVQPWHPRVHHHDIGRVRAGELDGGKPVAGLADHRHVRLSVQHHPESGPDQFLVVDENDPDAHAAVPGRSACSSRCTVSPSPARRGSLAVTW